MVGQALRPVLVGALLGVGAAFASGRVLNRLLFEIGPTDPGSFGTATVLLLAIALSHEIGQVALQTLDLNAENAITGTPRPHTSAPSPRTPRSQESSTEARVGVESATVPWAILTTECRIGDLLTRGDVCHLSADRGDAERCGVLLGGTPELVRLDEIRPAVYRVVWSLSTAASGRLRPARPVS